MNIKKIVSLCQKIEEYNGDPIREISFILARTIINNKLPWKISCTLCANQNSCDIFKKITKLIQSSEMFNDSEYIATANRCLSYEVIADILFTNSKNTEELFKPISREKQKESCNKITNKGDS